MMHVHVDTKSVSTYLRYISNVCTIQLVAPYCKFSLFLQCFCPFEKFNVLLFHTLLVSHSFLCFIDLSAVSVKLFGTLFFFSCYSSLILLDVIQQSFSCVEFSYKSWQSAKDNSMCSNSCFFIRSPLHFVSSLFILNCTNIVLL